MFNNLIESASHSGEMKRRGSFFLFALGGYSLLFAASGVASVLAYDAHLEKQNLELVSLVAPIEEIADIPRPVVDRRPSAASSSDQPHPAIRTDTPPSNDPTLTKKGVSASTNQPPPLRDGESYVIGPKNISDSFGGRNGDDRGPGYIGSAGIGGVRPTVDDPPPPAKQPTPKPDKKSIVMTGGVVNGKATYLPSPAFSAMANAVGAQGLVVVQVLIDEQGNVISAKAISGHPLLQPEAVRAARLAKFSPTLLSKQPVKVSGLINYNFIRH